jgi:hypothetical protein
MIYAEKNDSTIRAVIAINIFALFEALFGTIWKFSQAAGVTIGDFCIVRTSLMFCFTLPLLFYRL